MILVMKPKGRDEVVLHVYKIEKSNNWVEVHLAKDQNNIQNIINSGLYYTAIGETKMMISYKSWFDQLVNIH